MGKSTSSMAIYNSYVKLPEGTFQCNSSAKAADDSAEQSEVS